MCARRVVYTVIDRLWLNVVLLVIAVLVVEMVVWDWMVRGAVDVAESVVMRVSRDREWGRCRCRCRSWVKDRRRSRR
jgi:hypothetical protein